MVTNTPPPARIWVDPTGCNFEPLSWDAYDCPTGNGDDYEYVRWQPIDTAPKDGAIIDVWLGDTDDPVTTAGKSDIEFYCSKGTKRSPAWHWNGDRFRPHIAGLVPLTTFVQPSHWMPISTPPTDRKDPTT